MRVFVTGGAGVIGMELVARLIQDGADVFVADLKKMPEEFYNKVRYRQGDLNEMTKSELAAFDPEIIINLAATFERSTESLGFWDENFHHNVNLSHHLMTIARECISLKRVVFASSYLVYDQDLYQFTRAQKTPRRLSEHDLIKPRNLTGMAKLSHEMELQFLEGFADCRFSTISVRIFRGYGRRSRDIISRWIRSLIKGEKISVYRPEGMFDYIYASDSAEGLIKLAFSDNARGIVNLGTGHSHHVQDVIEILKMHFINADISYEDTRIPFEASEACIDKLESLVGWRPSKTLEEGIAEIIEFEKQNVESLEGSNNLHKPHKAVLMTSSSRKIPLLRALREAATKLDKHVSVIAGDIDPQAVSIYEAERFWQMPRLTDDGLKEIIDQCCDQSITCILPTRDGELDYWSNHRESFMEAGIEVIISSPEAIARCRDKLKFAEFAQSPAIPATLNPETFAESPMVVKERFGAGSVGIGLNLSYEDAVRHAKTLEQPIFQPFINGQEISIDSWISKTGKVAGVVLRRRDRVMAGESQVTTTFSDKLLEKQMVEFILKLELRGPVVLQAIVSEGKIHVIECNPRFGGASTASIAVGLDSLYWSLAEVAEPNFSPKFIKTSHEVRQVRVPVDLKIYDSNF